MFHQDKFRPYSRCSQCELIFVPPQYHLSINDEKKRYDLHQNSPDRDDYKRFLSKMVNCLSPKLKPGVSGLDYGSGTVPVFSKLMAEKSFQMKNYDLHYAAFPELLKHKYNYLTCIETAEHFRFPDREWRLIFSLLMKGGWLGIMTELYNDAIDFTEWYYKGDRTHICFYTKDTFVWLADRYGLKADFYGTSIILLQSGE